MNAALEILKQTGLRVTDARKDILFNFLGQEAAISQGDIENTLGADFDRVTIYRTLKTFTEKGLIHKILDDNGGVKYALCKEQCNDEGHHHDHLHFKCVVCMQTTCLEKNEIPAINLPDGYQKNEINILVQGVCPNCK